MSRFDAVLFDAGGVLVLPDPAVTGPVLAAFGGTMDEQALMKAHFAAAHAMDHARADGEHADWCAYRRAYGVAAGVTPDRQDDAAAALGGLDGSHWVRPVHGAVAVLAQLTGRGVPIGIVSNAEGQIEGDLARLGICAVDTPGLAPVVCVVDSHVVGISKPNPRIFELALSALGLPASRRIAYVGDTVFFDVRASSAAGLTPLLYDPHGFHLADPHPAAPATITALEQLLELV